MKSDDFELRGFGVGQTLLEQRIGRLEIRTGEPRLTVFEDALYVPSSVEGESPGVRREGGLLDVDGNPIADARDRRSNRAPLKVETPRTVEEEVIYLGPIYGHYGHFLLESLARTWALEWTNPSAKVFFHHGLGVNAASFMFQSWQREILDAFGIPSERVLLLNAPTRFRAVLVPQPLYGLSRWAHDRAGEPYRLVAERILRAGNAGVSSQPVYLSRRLLPGGKRLVVGEDELEAVLQENGFFIACPEMMPFADQVRLWNRHADIFAADGTAAHGVLFSRSRPRLHVLSPALPQLDYFLISVAARSSTTFIQCLGDNGRGTPHVGGRYFPQLLESDTLLDYLEDEGFLRSRLRARLMRRSGDRGQRYDEAWSYARLRQARQKDAELTRDEEQEARRLAMRSWPITIALAMYFVIRGRIGIDGLVTRFISLVNMETQFDRLARYASDVEFMALQIGKVCSPAVVNQLRTAIEDRFGIRVAITSSIVEDRHDNSIVVSGSVSPGEVASSVADATNIRGPERDVQISASNFAYTDRANYQPTILETDYYSLGRGTSVEFQEQFGWQARTDVEPWPVPDPIDWTANPYHDRNWYTQFHGWRMMDPYLQAYRATGNVTYVARLVPWMTAWPEYQKSATTHEQRTLASLGGMRATRVALLLDAYRSGALALTEHERNILYQLVWRDASWLAAPGNIALMNHAYFQIFGVEVLTRVLYDEPWAPAARESVMQTFQQLIRAQFTGEGVHVENSPSYHFYALDQIKRAGASETLASPEMNELFAKAWAVLPWLVFPDGLYADIGDCTGPGELLEDAGEHFACLGSERYAVAPFWRSGYGIIRSLPDVPPDQASMLLLVGTSMSHTHSHADKLSFELFEFGQRIIVDTGKYGYVRNPMRNYVESGVAHNTVGLATNPIRRTDVTLGGTRLYEPRVEDGAFELGGEVAWSTKQYAFVHRRNITYRPGKFIIIQDTLASPLPQQYASRLHFDRSLTVNLDGRILTSEVNGHTMRVELMDEEDQITIHRGEDDPIMGWQSVGYMKMEPTTMVEATCSGQNRTITWLITFD